MDEPKIVFDPHAGATPREAVEEIINRRNVRLTGQDEWYPVAFFLKTQEGEILGGLLGQIWGQWLSVATLAVREQFRGRGYMVAVYGGARVRTIPAQSQLAARQRTAADQLMAKT